MFGNSLKIFVCFCILILVACARPNYKSKTQELDNQDQQKTQCAYSVSKLNLCLSMNWLVKPTESDYGSFEFTFSNLGGEIQSLDFNDQVEVILWMPSMGHGSSPVFVETNDQKNWRANDVFFIMPGDWEIRFQIKRNEEMIDEVIIPLFI